LTFSFDTKVDIALSGEVQVTELAPATESAAPTKLARATPVLIRVSASELSRRVLVVARPSSG